MSLCCVQRKDGQGGTHGYNMSWRALSAGERTSSVRKRTLGHTHDTISSEIREAGRRR